MEPRREYDTPRDLPMMTDDDIFSRTERYIDTQKRMMQDRINQVMNSKPATVIKLNSDGTGVQQSISRISSTNGENQ